ncbi:F0F1 ATP synthase subunit B [Xanthobacteraceae bacterium A53D]
MNKTWKLAVAAALWGSAALALPATASSLDSVPGKPAPMVVAQNTAPATTPTQPAGAHAPGAEAKLATDAHGGHGEGGFPPFNPANFGSQLVWLVITFGALYFLMSRMTLPRIGRILEERHERIAKDLEEARLRKAESEEAQVAYEKALTEARGKANAIAGEARNRLNAETEANRKALETSLNAKLADAEKSIAATKATALSHVRGIAVDTTGAIVNALVGKSASPKDLEGAVDAALASKSA